jgi:hypothetical protein
MNLHRGNDATGDSGASGGGVLPSARRAPEDNGADPADRSARQDRADERERSDGTDRADGPGRLKDAGADSTRPGGDGESERAAQAEAEGQTADRDRARGRAEVQGPATAEPAPAPAPGTPQRPARTPGEGGTATDTTSTAGTASTTGRTGTTYGATPKDDHHGAPRTVKAGEPARNTGNSAKGDRTADIDRLSRRMDRAVGGFVDDPQRAVREADAVLDEAAGLIERRREELRKDWDGGRDTDTEKLRVALTHYRDLTRQLISLTTAS